MGSVVNVVLLVFKFMAGFLGGSAAMIADAVHSLSDFLTDIVVLVFVKISAKPKDESHDYGHGKYETLATSLIGLALLVVGAYILYGGTHRTWDAFHGVQLERPGVAALVAAVVSILMKEWTYGSSGAFAGSGGQCVASPQRCPFVYRYCRGHRRCHLLRKGLGGARSLGCHCGERVYHSHCPASCGWRRGRVAGEESARCRGRRDNANCTKRAGGERRAQSLHPQHRHHHCHRDAPADAGRNFAL